MTRSMMVALMVLGLASSATAQKVIVHVLKSGQFYHRPECLVVEEQKPVDLDEAVANSYVPCPECAPPRYVDKVLRDDGPSPYLKKKIAQRVAYQGSVPPGRQKTLKELAAEAAKGPQPVASAAPLGMPGGPAAAAPVYGTAPALQQAAQLAAPPRESTAAGNVPGTGGLLQAAQFAPTPMQQQMTYYGQPIPQPAASTPPTQ